MSAETRVWPRSPRKGSVLLCNFRRRVRRLEHCRYLLGTEPLERSRGQRHGMLHERVSAALARENARS